MYKTSPRRGKSTPDKNITIELIGVKVKISTEGLTLEALEELIFDISRGIGQKAFAGALEGYDKKLGKERSRGAATPQTGISAGRVRLFRLDRWLPDASPDLDHRRGAKL